MPETTPNKSPAPAVPTSPPARPTGWHRPATEISALLRKAEGGDAGALTEVTKMLVCPGTADILGGNIAQEAIRTLVTRYAGKNPVIRESVTRKLDELRAELLGQNPTPLEKLLVERVVATWLQLHHQEALFASKESYSLELGSYYQRVISMAQKRYLAAIKGLAEVRKLALPVLQVNIARKQVNVAASTVANAG